MANRSWDESEMHVLESLSDLKEQMTDLNSKVSSNAKVLHEKLNAMQSTFTSSIAVLNVKSGVWGALAGAVVTLGAIGMLVFAWFLKG